MADYPIAVGGLGGSGTRAVAMVLRELSFFIGSDLNQALDNLWFTLLFKQAGIGCLDPATFGKRLDLFSAAMTGRRDVEVDRRVLQDLVHRDRVHHNSDWLRERAETLLDALEGPSIPQSRWGWKEPNTHVVLDQLSRHLPGLRYIHVIRDGLDMAFSRNHGQITFWARELFDLDDQPTPRNKLRYWCLMHRRLDEVLSRSQLHVMLLPYEQLCENPRQWVQRIADFVLPAKWAAPLDTIVERIRAPSSIGRHLTRSLAGLESEDVEYAMEMRTRLSGGLPGKS